MARSSRVAFEVKSIPPFRDLKGRFARGNKKMLEDRRDFMRIQGRRMVELAQEEAPRRTGEFARGIRFRTFQKANEVGFSMTTPQPLGKWIIEGTKPHIIQAKNAKALRFLWEGGPRSSSSFTAYHFYASVKHPGTKANPFLSRAYRRWLPGARKGLNQIARDFVRFIQGASEASKKV